MSATLQLVGEGLGEQAPVLRARRAPAATKAGTLPLVLRPRPFQTDPLPDGPTTGPTPSPAADPARAAAASLRAAATSSATARAASRRLVRGARTTKRDGGSADTGATVRTAP